MVRVVRLTAMVGLVALALAGCVSMTPEAEGVRVVRNANSLKDCESLGEIESTSGHGGVATAGGLANNKATLRNETAALGWQYASDPDRARLLLVPAHDGRGVPVPAMIVLPAYKLHRIEVNAVSVDGCWNAEVRIRRTLSEEKPHPLPPVGAPEGDRGAGRRVRPFGSYPSPATSDYRSSLVLTMCYPSPVIAQRVSTAATDATRETNRSAQRRET
jgi:hypothetical protein